MNRSAGLNAAILLTLLGLGLIASDGYAEQKKNKEELVKVILATIRGFRFVYVEYVMDRVERAGIYPKEDWVRDPHAIMLPIQLVKAAGVEVKKEIADLEIGLISLSPINPDNAPKTTREEDTLRAMVANPKQTVLTFGDGAQFKGLEADFAIEQECADCHNHHPQSPKKDFKKGDLMGAIVVRVNE
ncbi:MAG: DUF3365 domain-containing protein [Nitrospirota bacterium]|nr:DUF3365 domain-containing protein [Nitrospirota bacterium]MDE3243268.1 DUF3365 domain-containing protein [Nitrospirota bacterium]